MSGAYSKPMPWSGGGSTKPPVANNYLDSHGLNPGLGNAGHTSFPSVVTAAPSQAARMANYTRSVCSTLIGPAMSRLVSHWVRASPVMLAPAI